MTGGDEKSARAPTADELAALLHFYAEAGVDSAVEESTVDRFEESRARSAAAAKKPSNQEARRAPAVSPAEKPVPAQPPSPQQPEATVPDEAAITDARETARNAQSIDALREALESFNGCNLRFGARSTVFADGNPQSDVMFIGEAPGRDEDRQGLPFVGRAGSTAGQDAQGDRTGPDPLLHHQHDPLAPAGQPVPDAA